MWKMLWCFQLRIPSSLPDAGDTDRIRSFTVRPTSDAGRGDMHFRIPNDVAELLRAVQDGARDPAQPFDTLVPPLAITIYDDKW